MLRTAVILLFAGLLVVACQNSQSIATPKPTRKMAEVSGKSFTTLKEGQGVYARHCAQCHEHRLPSSASLPQWHDQISTMADLAGISKEEEKSLQIYLDEFTDR
ncbi:MAG: hypothetical protein ACSHYF_15155 [Verrucomicrobiaceae bacterium]